MTLADSAAFAVQGQHLLIPEDCPESYATLMSACWRRDPNARPSFDEIQSQLERMLGELPGCSVLPAIPSGDDS